MSLVYNQYNSNLRTLMALGVERPEQIFRRLEKRQDYPVENVIGTPKIVSSLRDPRPRPRVVYRQRRLTSQTTSALDDNRHQISLPSSYTIRDLPLSNFFRRSLSSVPHHTLAPFSGGGYSSLFLCCQWRAAALSYYFL